MARSTAISALADELRGAGSALRDRSDTEVLFQLIRRDGVRRAVERIDGMFAFAFRDGAPAPFIWCATALAKSRSIRLLGPVLVFASEVTALRAIRDFRMRRPTATRPTIFCCSNICRERSRDGEGIAKLEPGTILAVKDGRIAVERYWRPRGPLIGQTARSEAEPLDRLDELLRASVRDRIVADVPVGVFLSGGVNSSLIAALARESRARSHGLHRAGRAETALTRPLYAVEVARHLGVRHEIVESRRHGICCAPSMRSPRSSASRSGIRRCCRPISFAAPRAA